MSYGTLTGGVSTWLAYIWSIINTVWAYLFDLDSTHYFSWSASDRTGGWPNEVDTPQIIFNGNYPNLSDKGRDIIASIMTIVHNGLVFVAEISTLLPSNALTG